MPNVWKQGYRCLTDDNEVIRGFVSRIIREVLHCHDPLFAEEIKPFIFTCFTKIYHQKFNTIKGRYRNNLTDYREFQIQLTELTFSDFF